MGPSNPPPIHLRLLTFQIILSPERGAFRDVREDKLSTGPRLKPAEIQPRIRRPPFGVRRLDKLFEIILVLSLLDWAFEQPGNHLIRRAFLSLTYNFIEAIEESSIEEIGSLFFYVITALKTRLDSTINYANPRNRRSLSPRRCVTISNPISSGIGKETLSGGRCSTATLTINLTFHSTSVSPHLDTSRRLREPRHTSPFIPRTLFTPREESNPLCAEIVMISLITPPAGSNPLPATGRPNSGSK